MMPRISNYTKSCVRRRWQASDLLRCITSNLIEMSEIPTRMMWDGQYEFAMPQPKRFGRSIPPPIGKRRCPYCAEPMFLSTIEPAQKAGHDQRTFECSSCPYAETITVKFKGNA